MLDSPIIYGIAIVLIFGAMIAFHEAGHFLVAKWARIRVYEFALGMGPILGSFRRGETQYSLRAVPIGGFVRAAGLEGEEEEEIPDSFNKKPIGTRIAVIAAGPLMNVVLAAITFFFAFSVFGQPTGEVTNEIDKVIKGKPAAAAGLQAGDKLVEVNGVGYGVTYDDFMAMREEISSHPNERVTVVVERGGRRLTFEIVPAEEKVQNLEPVYAEDGKELLEIKQVNRTIGFIGVVFVQKTQKIPIGMAMVSGVTETWNVVYGIGNALSFTVRGKAPVDVRGPVGIVTMMYDEAKVSWMGFITFAGIFNVMIAILNLLPFPALDGSRIGFLLVEAVRGRPIDPRKEAIVHTVGLVILLFLIFVVTVGDVLRLVRPN